MKRTVEYSCKIEDLGSVSTFLNSTKHLDDVVCVESHHGLTIEFLFSDGTSLCIPPHPNFQVNAGEVITSLEGLRVVRFTDSFGFNLIRVTNCKHGCLQRAVEGIDAIMRML